MTVMGNMVDLGFPVAPEPKKPRPQPTTKPLAAARRRMRLAGSDSYRKRAVSLATQQHTPANIARRLNASPEQVDRWLKDPQSQAELEAHREKVRLQIMRRTASGIIDLTMDTVEQAGRERDAKALDAATRAALNLERLTVSAAGEAQRIDVTGAVNVDVRALLAKLR